MKIRLNKTIGIIMLVIGLFNLLIFLLIMAAEGEIDYSNILLSVFIILLSIGYIRGAYFEVSENSLTLLNMIGNKTQEMPFSDKTTFEVKGKNVVFTSQTNKKIKLYAFTADPTDWAAFLKWLDQ